MKTKLHLSSNTGAKRIIKCHGIFSFLIILFLTVSSFGQVSSISFEFCGGAVTFGAEDGRDANGFPYWINGIDNQTLPLEGYTLYVEDDGGNPTWSLREPGDNSNGDFPDAGYVPGPRYYKLIAFSNSICENNWMPDTIPCTLTVICDPVIDIDNDNDGYYASIDCNDNNNLIFPGATEVCDGIDNDCDGAVDEGFNLIAYYVDSDNDGFGDKADIDGTLYCSDPGVGFSLSNNDCDDTNEDINPGATEICHDADDNDCDGFTDEDDAACGEVISYCNADLTKVLICHNGKNKCVQINALDAHIAHGDTLGSCDGDPYEGDLYTKSTKGKTSNTDEAVLGFTTRVWPNPSGDDFNIKITTADNLNGVDVQVIDMTGKMIHNAYINYNENYKFGSKLESGVYFVKLIQGKTTQVKKVIKR